MDRLKTLILCILAPLVLSSCVLTPGKFVSTLNVRADGQFTFTYQGEVIAADVGGQFAKQMAKGKSGAKSSTDGADADADAEAARKKAAEAEKADQKFQAIAAALAKEPGFKSVEYKGDGVMLVDYAITSTLTHAFVWPYNLDAEAIFPFVMIELRPDSTVRVKAPGFANAESKSPMGGSKPNERMQGSFTLTTDAQIVSQNNEQGAQKLAGIGKLIRWRITPLTKDAPTAVLKLKEKQD